MTDQRHITHLLQEDGDQMLGIFPDKIPLAHRALTHIRALEAQLQRAETAIAQTRASVSVIEQNLSEYIDRKGKVDVTIALAFETARAIREGA